MARASETSSVLKSHVGIVVFSVPANGIVFIFSWDYCKAVRETGNNGQGHPTTNLL